MTRDGESIPLGLVLSALSAVLLILAFPPFGIWPLIWVAFVPMLLAQYRILPPRLTSVAPAVSVGGWLAGYFIPIFAGSGSYMLALPLVIAVVGFLTERTNRRFHVATGYRWFIPQGVASWVGVELLRGFVPIMGTWGYVGYTLSHQPWLIQPVSIAGILGIDLLIMLVNFAVALWMMQALNARSGRRAAPRVRRLAQRWLVVTAGCAVIWTGVSILMLTASPGDVVRVAAVQVPGRPEGETLGYETDRDAIIRELYDRTRAATGDGARIVVWPEGALNFDPQTRDTDSLLTLSRETGAVLVVGYMAAGEQGPWRNEAVVVHPTRGILGVYGKDHPVTFGGERNTSLGTYPVYDTGVAMLGTIICYDMDFTDTARKVTRNGAQIVAAPSLDWPAIAELHYGHVIFRAVENRVAMVKSDGGYDSAVVDSFGRVIARAVTRQASSATVVADVALGAGHSVASRLGDWVGWVCLAGMFALTPARRRVRRADASE